MPLTIAQLQGFPAFKDSCHRSGLIGIPGFLLAQHFELNDDEIKSAVEVLLEVFPLLCITKGVHRVLVDYTRASL